MTAKGTRSNLSDAYPVAQLKARARGSFISPATPATRAAVNWPTSAANPFVRPFDKSVRCTLLSYLEG